MKPDPLAIPDGWTRAGWLARLEQLATCCEEFVPVRAAEMREITSRLQNVTDSGANK